MYLFVLNGDINVGDINLNRRDALAIEDTSDLKINTKSNSQLLLIEIPMNMEA